MRVEECIVEAAVVTSCRTKVSRMRTGHDDETRPTEDLLLSLVAKTANSFRRLRGFWH